MPVTTVTTLFTQRICGQQLTGWRMRQQIYPLASASQKRECFPSPPLPYAIEVWRCRFNREHIYNCTYFGSVKFF